VFLFGIGAPDKRLDDVLARCSAYAEAGADGLFVPGLTDLAVLTALAKNSPLPINAMAGAGAPLVAELAAVGVRRVSVGTAVAQAAYTLAKHTAAELLTTGSYAGLADALDFGTINGLFARSWRRWFNTPAGGARPAPAIAFPAPTGPRCRCSGARHSTRLYSGLGGLAPTLGQRAAGTWGGRGDETDVGDGGRRGHRSACRSGIRAGVGGELQLRRHLDGRHP
jgi:hypothetical protein